MPGKYAARRFGVWALMRTRFFVAFALLVTVSTTLYGSEAAIAIPPKDVTQLKAAMDSWERYEIKWQSLTKELHFEIDSKTEAFIKKGVLEAEVVDEYSVSIDTLPTCRRANVKQRVSSDHADLVLYGENPDYGFELKRSSDSDRWFATGVYIDPGGTQLIDRLALPNLELASLVVLKRNVRLADLLADSSIQITRAVELPNGSLWKFEFVRVGGGKFRGTALEAIESGEIVLDSENDWLLSSAILKTKHSNADICDSFELRIEPATLPVDDFQYCKVRKISGVESGVKFVAVEVMAIEIYDQSLTETAFRLPAYGLAEPSWLLRQDFSHRAFWLGGLSLALLALITFRYVKTRNTTAKS